MSKHPNEIKSDYIQAEKSAKALNDYVDNKPFFKDGVLVKHPIFFESEIEKLREDALKQKGVLEDDLKRTKTKSSKKKNLKIQNKLDEAIEYSKKK
ncbi:MAG: hypothetical protein E7281_00085 [Lachnospiraceae bacterium]|nr:hypothetical protein [Lachnospiraceae bacterium]